MKPNSVAIIGAAETTRIGTVPDMSELGLVLDGALNALADAGLTAADIDGVATAPSVEVEYIVQALGIVPTWVDSTQVGGCSFMHHVQHAAAAINEGLCKTVLIAMAESGYSGVGTVPWASSPSSWEGQFEAPYGLWGPSVSFTLPALRFLKETGTTLEQLASVAVVQREWAALNPRAKEREPLTVEDVLHARMIAYPFTRPMCCLVTDGGGALVLTSAERARDFPQKPVYVMGTGASVESWMASQLEDFTSSRAFRVSGQQAFREAGIGPADVDHLMIYDAFAHL
ncbi:MAG: thiolase, partial [Dehalococcoidia bacterium]